MQISVKKVNNLAYKVDVDIPNESIVSEQNKRFEEIKMRSHFPGFQPGIKARKNPKVNAALDKMVRSRFGNSVRREVISELVDNSIKTAIQQENLRPVGYPVIDSFNEPKDNENLTFSASLEVFPEINFPEATTFTLERLSADITESDVDDMAKKLTENHAQWVSVERAIQYHDKVTCDIKEAIGDDVELPAEFVKGVNLVILPPEELPLIIPGLIESFVGKKIGDEYSLDSAFPADWPEKNHAGKRVQYQVRIDTVEEKTVSSFDDSFVARVFPDEKEGIAGVRTKIREKLEQELKQAQHEDLKEQLLDGMVSQIAVEIPKTLLDREKEAVLRSRTPRGATPVKWDELTSDTQQEYELQAKRRTALGLILSEWMVKRTVRASREQISQVIMQEAFKYPDPRQIFKMYTENQGLYEQARFEANSRVLLDLLLTEVNYTEKTVTFKELIAMERAESPLPELTKLSS